MLNMNITNSRLSDIPEGRSVDKTIAGIVSPSLAVVRQPFEHPLLSGPVL
jgi:hypothetical protein